MSKSKSKGKKTEEAASTKGRHSVYKKNLGDSLDSLGENYNNLVDWLTPEALKKVNKKKDKKRLELEKARRDKFNNQDFKAK